MKHKEIITALARFQKYGLEPVMPILSTDEDIAQIAATVSMYLGPFFVRIALNGWCSAILLSFMFITYAPITTRKIPIKPIALGYS